MRVIALTVALLTSIASLLFVVDVERLSIDVTTSPFGWQRLTLVHCLACLPMTWLVSEWLAKLVPESKSRIVSALCGVIGIGVVSWTVINGGVIGRTLDANGLAFMPRLLARTVWPLSLQITTYSAVALLSERRAGLQYSKSTATALAGLVLFIAVVVPVTYLIPFADQQRVLADNAMTTQRTALAVRTLQRLEDVGVAKTFLFIDTRTKQKVEMTTREALAVQRKEVERRLARISQLQVTDDSLAGRLELAEHMAALELSTEAIEVLEPIASQDVRAAIEFGKLLQTEGRWEESSRSFQNALEQIPETAMDDEQSVAAQSQIFSALASNARELQQYDQAEQIYLQALEILPSRRALFHSQLARFYEDGGRKLKAREHMKQASEMSPEEHLEPANTLFLWSLLPIAVVLYLLLQDFVFT
ncbi:hypothetical protein ACFL2H_11205 [Planctomycetota bacterium]